jgi:hypothetical protein
VAHIIHKDKELAFSSSASVQISTDALEAALPLQEYPELELFSNLPECNPAVVLGRKNLIQIGT